MRSVVWTSRLTSHTHSTSINRRRQPAKTPEQQQQKRMYVKAANKIFKYNEIDLNMAVLHHSHYAVVLISCITGLAAVPLSVPLSVRLSVCLAQTPNSKTKGHRQTKIGVNVPQGSSNRCANFHFKRSKSEVIGCQKFPENDNAYMAYINVYRWLTERALHYGRSAVGRATLRN